MSRINPETDVLTFQCKDIVSRDIFVKKDLDSEDSGEHTVEASGNKLSGRRFQIQLFGADINGRSVALQVDNFRPFFYIRIPDVLATNAGAISMLKRWVLNGVPEDVKMYTSLDVCKHKTLFDYNGGALATFLMVTVPSQALWRSLKDKLLTKSSEPKIYEVRSLFGVVAIPILKTALRSDDVASLNADGDMIALKIYEANIDPVLRFFHIQNISPAGWVRVDANDWTMSDQNDAKVSVNAMAEWSDVGAATEASMANRVVGY